MNMKNKNDNLIALADSFMAIFGYKRKAIVRGNVIEPVEWDSKDKPKDG